MGIVVPYRDREEHLKVFLPHMRSYLKDIPHQFFIIEQEQEGDFNRGKLRNIGFTLAKDTCDYICFHDVDMLPRKADYSFPHTPVHLAYAVEQFNFNMPYPTYFGGVLLFNIKDFEAVNGYSNEYFGWGAEDEDLRHRCKIAHLEIENRKGYFSSFDHERPAETHPLVIANQDKLEAFLYGPEVIPEDGLKNLKYELLQQESKDNCHRYLVQL